MTHGAKLQDMQDIMGKAIINAHSIGRREALEEAAKAAEMIRDMHPVKNSFWLEVNDVVLAIRALIPKDKPDGD